MTNTAVSLDRIQHGLISQFPNFPSLISLETGVWHGHIVGLHRPSIFASLTIDGAAANGFTKPLEDEPDVLTLEVVAKVDWNWRLALHTTLAKTLELWLLCLIETLNRSYIHSIFLLKFVASLHIYIPNKQPMQWLNLLPPRTGGGVGGMINWRVEKKGGGC